MSIIGANPIALLVTMVFYQLATKAQALAMKAMGAPLTISNALPKSNAEHCNISSKRARSRGWDPSSRPLVLDGYIIDGLALEERSKSPVNLTSEFSRKSPWIDLVERSPAPILLLSAAVLLKRSGEFFGAMDIERRSLQESLAFHER
jgi:hypothetical protein